MSQLPVLQLVIPMLGAIIGILFKVRAYYITVVTSLISLFYAILLLVQLKIRINISYVLGDWAKDIGIEHHLNVFNQCLISYVCLVLLIFAVGTRKHIIQTIGKKQDIDVIYPIILFLHTGVIGMLSTNDIFNMYVFLEIASISTYILLTYSMDKAALVSALDYLIFNTVSATLILVGIGILLALTGHLNIETVFTKLVYENNKLVILTISMFVTGCFMKLAIFPLHFPTIKAYSRVCTSVLVYLVGGASITGIYILVKFLYFVLSPKVIYLSNLMLFLKIFGGTSLIAGGVLAYYSDSIKKIVISSCISSTGYIIILLSYYQSSLDLVLSFILVDASMKALMFMSVVFLEMSVGTTNCVELRSYGVPWVLKACFVVGIIVNNSLPITSGFINKFDLLSLMISNKDYIMLIIVIMGAFICLQYSYKLIVPFLSDVKVVVCNQNIMLLSIIALIILNFSLIFRVI